MASLSGPFFFDVRKLRVVLDLGLKLRDLEFQGIGRLSLIGSVP